MGAMDRQPDVGKLAMDIPDDIHQRGRAQAAYRGQTWKDWVIQAIAEKVERDEAERAEAERKRRSRP